MFERLGNWQGKDANSRTAAPLEGAGAIAPALSAGRPEKAGALEEETKNMSVEDAEFWTELVGRLTDKLEEVRKEQAAGSRQMAEIQKKLASLVHSASPTSKRYGS